MVGVPHRASQRLFINLRVTSQRPRPLYIPSVEGTEREYVLVLGFIAWPGT